MKKKLLSILLSVFMITTSFTTRIFANEVSKLSFSITSITIGDLSKLPENNISGSSLEGDICTAYSLNFYLFNESDNIIAYACNELGTWKWKNEGGSDYEGTLDFNSVSYVIEEISFIPNDGSFAETMTIKVNEKPLAYLDSGLHTGVEGYIVKDDGMLYIDVKVYPSLKTIADILPSKFPASDKDESWCNSKENNDVYIYNDGTYLVFAETPVTNVVSVSSVLTKAEKDPTWSETTTCRWVYSDDIDDDDIDDIEIQFNMTGYEGNELENIVVAHCWFGDCEGTYGTYSVTYDANGATSGKVPAAQTKTAGVGLTLATNTGNLAKTDYTFTGWNTQSDGKGTHYDAGETYETDEALLLYAEWVAVPVTKTIAEILATNPDFPAPPNAWINDNGSQAYYNSMLMSLFFDNSVDYFSVINSTLATKNGDYYEYIDADNVTYKFHLDGNNKLDSINVSNHEITDFNGTYAALVTVIFDTGVFGETVPSQTIPKGTTATKPADPVKEGYVFKYWSLLGEDVEFDFNTPINENAELTAIGRQIEIKDILPVDFPKVEQSGWVSGTKRLYLNVNSLYVNGPVLLVNNTPEKIQGTNDYKYDEVIGPGTTITFTFMMDNNDKLEKIKIEGDEGFNGEYVPYQYTNNPITKQVGYSQDVEFVTNATYTDPADTNVSVKIDNVLLGLDNYTVAHGSTIVKLKGDYIKNLPIGTHTITIEVTGYDPISQDFVIIPKTTPTPSPTPTSKPRYVAPKTGVN